jgi:hypothetical protein
MVWITDWINVYLTEYLSHFFNKPPRETVTGRLGVADWLSHSVSRSLTDSMCLSFSLNNSLFNWLTFWVSMYIEQSPWEADNCPANVEITNILWKQEVRYHVHNSPPLVHILSEINPVHNLPSCFFEISFNSNLPFMSTCSRWSLCFRFSYQNSLWTSLPCMPHAVLDSSSLVWTLS